MYRRNATYHRDSADLLLDSRIRFWVFLPIVLITFFMGILRHYVSMLLVSEKSPDMHQVIDSQLFIRCRVLRENYKYIPKEGFLMRKYAFNKPGDGYLTQRRDHIPRNILADPVVMSDVLKNNLTNVVPTVILGGWINWMFSGFLTTRVPFPLTLRFKMMLQRGMELAHLDPSWVSSASWYFLNVFGLRNIYILLLGDLEEVILGSDMEENMVIAALAMPNDTKIVFKGEWETLQVIKHFWALEGVEFTLDQEFPDEPQYYDLPCEYQRI